MAKATEAINSSRSSSSSDSISDSGSCSVISSSDNSRKLVLESIKQNADQIDLEANQIKDTPAKET